jgi:hypothetical protein
MRWTHLLVFVLLLAMATPAMAQAQEAATTGHPQGWWGSFGAGISGLRFACKDCSESQPVYEAPAGVISFGKSIGTKVAFGVEIGAALPTTEDRKVAATTLSGMARWYPSQAPFFLKFGVGLSRARLSLTTDGQTQSAMRNGSGISFGAGYDVRLGKSVAITPLVGWYMSAIGDIGVGDTVRQNVSWNTWSVGVGVTIY